MMPFKDLPVAAQLAMIHYMAIDGEAWDYTPLDGKLPDPSGKTLIDSVPYYVAKYGDEMFGYHPGVDTKQIQSSIMLDVDIAIDWKNWQEYHEWYRVNCGGQDHDITKPLWPVILSSHDDETLQDGWHRFHCYSQKNVPLVPILYYRDYHWNQWQPKNPINPPNH
jgi:hypothetical protein